MPDALTDFSHAVADRVAAAAPALLCLYPDARAQRSAYLWQPGVAITSEQYLPDHAEVAALLPGGAHGTATLVGRDPGTNIAVLRLDAATSPDRPAAHVPRPGEVALAIGAMDGRASVRVGSVHRVGPAWDSMAGGRIDHHIQLDLPLSGREEGGPVLAADGALMGMSTLGPRRRAIVIPTATLERIVPQLLSGGRVQQGWLGLGLQPVGLPASLHGAAGRDAGLMVVSLAAGGPAETAGVLPGDILLDVAGEPAPHPRSVARALSGEQIGKSVPLRLLRAGSPMEVRATVAMRPAA